MPGNKAIGYLYPKRFFFVAKDIEGLAEHRMVFEHGFIHGAAYLLPFDLLAELFFLIRIKRRGVRDVIAHFAGYHTVLPVLLGFRTHIIIAGSDACSFPGIGYGSFRKPIMRRAMAFSLRKATTLLPVHASLEQFQNSYSDLGPPEQGFGHFVPSLATRTVPIPYGFDLSQWPDPSKTKFDRTGVLCVAFGASNGNAVHYRKGLDLVLKAAERLPHVRFTLFGLADPESYVGVPKNVSCLGIASPGTLRHVYAEHSVYVQASVMEGFPNALCEAMLMGCIPVVSDVTSMPAIVGGAGELVKRRDVDQFLAALEKVLSSPPEERARCRITARERVVPFTLQKRMQRLNELLDTN